MCFFYLYSLLCGADVIPVDISIESDIPIGAGLGSSAALSVCLSAGLLTIQDSTTKSCNKCIQNSTNQHRSLGNFVEIEISKQHAKEICDIAYISEQILHGRPSGIDNAVSTYGGLVQLSNFKVRN